MGSTSPCRPWSDAGLPAFALVPLWRPPVPTSVIRGIGIGHDRGHEADSAVRESSNSLPPRTGHQEFYAVARTERHPLREHRVVSDPSLALAVVARSSGLRTRSALEPRLPCERVRACSSFPLLGCHYFTILHDEAMRIG